MKWGSHWITSYFINANWNALHLFRIGWKWTMKKIEKKKTKQINAVISNDKMCAAHWNPNTIHWLIGFVRCWYRGSPPKFVLPNFNSKLATMATDFVLNGGLLTIHGNRFHIQRRITTNKTYLTCDWIVWIFEQNCRLLNSSPKQNVGCIVATFVYMLYCTIMHPREHNDPVKVYLVFGKHAIERTKTKKAAANSEQSETWIWHILYMSKPIIAWHF